jgi:hypothetical protein
MVFTRRHQSECIYVAPVEHKMTARSASGFGQLGRVGAWVWASVAAAACVGLLACEGCKPTGAPANGAGHGDTSAGPPTVRLYLMSDLAGALEPCGCTKDQLGGLGHLGAWVKSEKAHAPAAVLVSAGPLFFLDDVLDPERADQDRIKAETIARVLRGLDFAAFSTGANDWAAGAPSLDALVAASGAAAIDGIDPAAPFVSEAVRRVGGVRVGFVGYGQPAGDRPAAPADVAQAVRRGVDAAKAQGANVLVALLSVGRGAAKRIADAVPELNVVVVGSPGSHGEANTTAADAEEVGGVLVVQPANHLQSVAVLDLFVRDPIEPGHVLKLADGGGLELARKREDLGRRIDDLRAKIAAWQKDPAVSPADLDARKRELGGLEKERDALASRPPAAPAHGSYFRYALQPIAESLGKDPAIDAEMVAYYKAVDDHNRVLFADRKPPPHAKDEAFYVGIDECASCHAPAKAVWEHTAHARAYATLSSQFKEFNLECVGCHVTGYEKPGGSTVTHVDKLRDVQCEVCHGPGSKHLLSPLDPETIIAKPQASVCLSCHHPPHVEHFDAVAAMHSILGPGHGGPQK